MRNALVQLCLVIIGVLSVHAARFLVTSSFRIKVVPVGATRRVLAIKGLDSLPMRSIGGTYFLQTIGPGRWEIWIQAQSPYKDFRREVTVSRGGTADLGEVKLSQE
ncbi:MAG TPA: hypothetical protein VGR89_10515 [Puia sp.]|nr:hypothetical protein [Puia sp.]